MLIPLDDWVDKCKPVLAKDIETHLSVFIKDPEEAGMLLRLIMTSIRQDHENPTFVGDDTIWGTIPPKQFIQ